MDILAAHMVEEATRGKSLALEVGCGSGAFAPYFKCPSIGIDISLGKELKEGSAGLWRHPGDKVLATASSLPFRLSVFDVVTAYGVLELVKDLDSTMREIVRTLKPRGQILAVTTSYPKVPGYRNKLTFFKLFRLLRNYGFKVKIRPMFLVKLFTSNYTFLEGYLRAR